MEDLLAIDLLAIKGTRAAQRQLLREMQAIYRRQGVEVNEERFECLVRQMTNYVKIAAAGHAPRLQESSLVERDLVCDHELAEGQLASPRQIYRARTGMRGGTPGIETRRARLAVGQPVLLGLAETVLEWASWIAAASFQNTRSVLSEAAIAAKSDPLGGIKENVVVGRPIPNGIGQGPTAASTCTRPNRTTGPKGNRRICLNAREGTRPLAARVLGEGHLSHTRLLVSTSAAPPHFFGAEGPCFPTLANSTL